MGELAQDRVPHAQSGVEVRLGGQREDQRHQRERGEEAGRGAQGRCVVDVLDGLDRPLGRRVRLQLDHLLAHGHGLRHLVLDDHLAQPHPLGPGLDARSRPRPPPPSGRPRPARRRSSAPVVRRPGRTRPAASLSAAAGRDARRAPRPPASRVARRPRLPVVLVQHPLLVLGQLDVGVDVRRALDRGPVVRDPHAVLDLLRAGERHERLPAGQQAALDARPGGALRLTVEVERRHLAELLALRVHHGAAAPRERGVDVGKVHGFAATRRVRGTDAGSTRAWTPRCWSS